MFRFTKAFPLRLLIVAMFVSLAVLAGACVGVPASPPPAPALQDAVRTPEFETQQLPPAAQAAPELSTRAKSNDCPGLDSALAQIAASPDPLAQARQLQLTIKNDKIQVVLLLNQADTSFLQSYDVEIGAQAEARVQAFAPPGRLCDLAKSGKVLRISLPAQAAP